MSYFSELEDAFHKISDGDIQEKYRAIECLLDDIEENGLEHYRDALSSSVEDAGRCDACYAETVTTVVGEDVSEFWGSNVVHPETAQLCTECGRLA